MPINDFIPSHAANVIPDNDLSQAGVGLYFGSGAGVVNLITEAGQTLTFQAILGKILKLRFTKIRLTGTTTNNLTRLMNGPFPTYMPGPVTLSGLTTIGSVLSILGDTNYGNPTPVLTYQWQRNGVNIAGQTGNTHTIAAPTIAGNEISCIVTATNPAGAVTLTSNSITVT